MPQVPIYLLGWRFCCSFSSVSNLMATLQNQANVRETLGPKLHCLQDNDSVPSPWTWGHQICPRNIQNPWTNSGYNHSSLVYLRLYHLVEFHSTSRNWRNLSHHDMHEPLQFRNENLDHLVDDLSRKLERGRSWLLRREFQVVVVVSVSVVVTVMRAKPWCT